MNHEICCFDSKCLRNTSFSSHPLLRYEAHLCFLSSNFFRVLMCIVFDSDSEYKMFYSIHILDSYNLNSITLAPSADSLPRHGKQEEAENE